MIQYDKPKLLVATFVLILFSACGPSEPQKAVKKLNLAESLLVKGDTTMALLLLDSITTAYPKAIVEVRKATQLSNRIYVSMIMEKRYSMAGVKVVIDSLMKNFSPEKGEFERYTNYIPNVQSLGKNWSRSYIKVWLNEKGDLMLSSNYYGAVWLNHTAIRVYDKEYEVETDSIPVGDPYNYQGDFGGSKWERVTYHNGQAGEVLKLISSHPELKLKAAFVGKQQYYIVLEERDKNAVKQAVTLANALKARIQLEEEISLMQGKIKSEDNL